MVRVKWTVPLRKQLVVDFNLFSQGKLTARALRQRYNNASVAALRMAAYRGGYRVRQLSKTQEVPTLLSTPVIPNNLKGIAKRLSVLGAGEKDIRNILFGSNSHLTDLAAKRLESLVNSSGMITVKLFTEDDNIGFQVLN